MNHLSVGRYRGAVDAKAARELVSQVDRDSEALIVGAIMEAYPTHAILGEEGGVQAAPLEGARYRWIVDPLDGTTNYLHGHPFFAVSIGVERVAQGEPPTMTAGVVFAPVFGELFLAARGIGAFLNSPVLPLQVAETSSLDDALVSTGFAYDSARWPNEARFRRVSEVARGVRRCGAAALDLAYVAAGRYDGFWEVGLQPHDVAAGALLVEQAGGRVTDLTGGADWLDGRSIVAAPPRLHEELRALVERS